LIWMLGKCDRRTFWRSSAGTPSIRVITSTGNNSIRR
jgi:hypothetical protein